MRRSAVSILSIIAEGHARNSTQEMMSFCSIALGSAAELETQLVIARERNFGKTVESVAIGQSLDELSRMLHGLIRTFRNRQQSRSN